MAQPIGYSLTMDNGSTITFCTPCALRCTALGMVIAGVGMPSDMDDAIARIALAQVERGLNIDTPAPVYQSEHSECMGCRAPLVAVPA